MPPPERDGGKDSRREIGTSGKTTCNSGDGETAWNSDDGETTWNRGRYRHCCFLPAIVHVSFADVLHLYGSATWGAYNMKSLLLYR